MCDKAETLARREAELIRLAEHCEREAAIWSRRAAALRAEAKEHEREFFRIAAPNSLYAAAHELGARQREFASALKKATPRWLLRLPRL